MQATSSRCVLLANIAGWNNQRIGLKARLQAIAVNHLAATDFNGGGRVVVTSTAIRL